jgi:hypothetical protein
MTAQAKSNTNLKLEKCERIAEGCYHETPSNKLHDVLELLKMLNLTYDQNTLQKTLRVVRRALRYIHLDMAAKWRIGKHIPTPDEESLHKELGDIVELLAAFDKAEEAHFLMTLMRVVRHALTPLQEWARREEATAHVAASTEVTKTMAKTSF